MALARAFVRYLDPMPRYAAADNRRTRHLILRGVRSRGALAPGPSDTVVEEGHDSRAVLEGTRRAHDAQAYRSDRCGSWRIRAGHRATCYVAHGCPAHQSRKCRRHLYSFPLALWLGFAIAFVSCRWR